MDEQFIYGELKAERLLEALMLVREVFLEYEAPNYFDD